MKFTNKDYSCALPVHKMLLTYHNSAIFSSNTLNYDAVNTVATTYLIIETKRFLAYVIKLFLKDQHMNESL